MKKAVASLLPIMEKEREERTRLSVVAAVRLLGLSLRV
jgi:hypothetical protein